MSTKTKPTSQYEQTFGFSGNASFKFQAVRDETAGAWCLKITREGADKPILSGAFPANFHTDKRTAKDFLRDLTVALWPASHAADLAKKHAAWDKRNRHKVM